MSTFRRILFIVAGVCLALSAAAPDVSVAKWLVAAAAIALLTNGLAVEPGERP
jgi:hypothetical protein